MTFRPDGKSVRPKATPYLRRSQPPSIRIIAAECWLYCRPTPPVSGRTLAASFPLRAFDHAFEGLPQRRDVAGVRLVLQRPEYATGNRDDVGVAAPASGGELV